MYFTQEDYTKIKNWLQANSVKDTEFPEAYSLSLNEQLTIIQRGENKRIKLEDLVNFLFSQSDSELDTSSTKPIQNQAVARAIYELQNRKFIEIVEELPPTSNAKDNVVYILLDKVGEDNNLFTEWIKVNNTWEKVGEFKAEIDLSPYLKIQDSPFEIGDAENSAVLKGGNNQVTNANEVALGKYNISNSDTQFSIGIGASDTDRKNAVEVKANGDIYIEGVECRIQDKLNATDILDGQLIELSNKVNNLPQGDDFDKQGNYPLLHVGTADDLAGRGESVPAEFGFRASGGKSIKDGRAYIKSIKGNSVVWNQRINRTYKTTTHNGVTFTVNSDGSVTANGTSSADATLSYLSILRTAVYSSHKYFVKGGASGGSVKTYYFGDGNNLNCYDSAPIITNALKDAATVTFAFRVLAGVTVENITFLTPVVIDLTQMFGVGNEPSTIEEFNARVATLGVDMNAYNEGQVIHCNTESIKSVGDNAWDEEWEVGTYDSANGKKIDSDATIRSKNLIKVLPNTEYYISIPQDLYGTYPVRQRFYREDGSYIGSAGQNTVGGIFNTPADCAYVGLIIYSTTYNHDITISLYHSGWKAEVDNTYKPYWEDTLPLPIIRNYFRQGMKSAGTAHDEIRYNKASGKWEAVQRIGEVDLGNCAFYKDSSKDFFKAIVDGMLVKPNYVCAKYDNIKYAELGSVKGIYLNIESTRCAIGISDPSYGDDYQKFRQDIQGVMLYYELAEPIVTELDAEDQNFRDYYNVADFGTEMSQSSVPSAPFSADIIYQFNAVDMIREHEIEITELQNVIKEQQSVIATMQAQLASLTSNY